MFFLAVKSVGCTCRISWKTYNDLGFFTINMRASKINVFTRFCIFVVLSNPNETFLQFQPVDIKVKIIEFPSI